MDRKRTKSTVLRALEAREPKIHENVKTGMFIKGHKTSQLVNDVLRDLCSLKKPNAQKYNKKKKNKTTGPFEDETTIEFFATKCDASLFMYGLHTKKRPHNLIIGRFFDYHVLDMMEFGISDFKSISEFHPKKPPMYGSKPCFAIMGSLFQTDEKYKAAANLLVDFFRGQVVDSINLQGLDHVIVLAVGDELQTISFRHYAIQLLKSGTHVPKVELDEVGPSLTLTFRRDRLAGPELAKSALKQPKELKPKKQKNVTTNAMHDKVAKVHVGDQGIEGISATAKKPKAIRTHGYENKKRARSHTGDETLASPPKKQKKDSTA